MNSELREPAADVAARYRAGGWWDGETLGTVLDASLRRSAALPFVVHSSLRPFDGTVGDVDELARRLAGALRARGLGAGDVVAFQLPNWAEAAAAFWGLALLGAVAVPVVPTYGPAELRHILQQSGARSLVIAREFGRRDRLAEVESIRAACPDLELVGVVGDGALPRWATSFDVLLAAEPLPGASPVDPAAPAVIGWTSGTSAAPKGAVLTGRALAAEARFHMAAINRYPRPLLEASPVSHVTGMLTTVLVPPYSGVPVHLLDAWNAGEALRICREQQLMTASGAIVFAQQFVDHPEFTPADAVHIAGSLGGSTVPASFVHRLQDLGVSVRRGYGCTEHPSVALASPESPATKRAFTDGHPAPGVEIRVVDEVGADVPRGTPGEILTRGPDLFAGYLDPRSTAEALDTDGWFATGDIGVQDDEGWLTIVDRRKDIIIRAGENISALEVESAIAAFPGVLEVAVVAAPDARLGEHACAFVRMADGARPFDLAELRGRLRETGLATFKWPEELRFVETPLPRTPSGKLRKVDLRALARNPT